MKKTFSIIALFALLLCSTMPASANPIDSTDLEQTLINALGVNGFEEFDGTLEGCFKITFLGSDAAHENVYFTDDENNPLLNNVDDNPGETVLVNGIENTNFKDLTDGVPTLNINDGDPVGLGGVVIYQLLANWDVFFASTNSNVLIPEGCFVIGFGDGDGNLDFNDMVLAACEAECPVPAPGAIILLASGICGLIGLRKKD